MLPLVSRLGLFRRNSDRLCQTCTHISAHAFNFYGGFTMTRFLGRGLTARLGRTAALALLATAPLLATAVPAHAADSETAKQVLGDSGCTKDLVRSGSSKARLLASGYSYVDNDHSKAVISRTRATVKATSCTGTSDNGVSVGLLSVKMKWIVTSTGLGTCDFGLPSGVKCTIDRKETTLSRSYTCRDKSSCSKLSVNEFQVYPKPGYKILTVTYQQSYSGKQPKKASVSGSTNQRTWG